MSAEWPLWEVFSRSQPGLAHKHVGSVHAADAKMAIEAARDTYTRRMEGVSIWVLPSAAGRSLVLREFSDSRSTSETPCSWV